MFMVLLQVFSLVGACFWIWVVLKVLIVFDIRSLSTLSSFNLLQQSKWKIYLPCYRPRSLSWFFLQVFFNLPLYWNFLYLLMNCIAKWCFDIEETFWWCLWILSLNYLFSNGGLFFSPHLYFLQWVLDAMQMLMGFIFMVLHKRHSFLVCLYVVFSWLSYKKCLYTSI